jgi:hypothetical protein
MTGAAAIADSMIPNSEVAHLLTAEFLTPKEISGLLKVSRKTLADWRLKRTGPPFFLKPRGVVVYGVESFRRYLRDRQHCLGKLGERKVRIQIV